MEVLQQSQVADMINAAVTAMREWRKAVDEITSRSLQGAYLQQHRLRGPISTALMADHVSSLLAASYQFYRKVEHEWVEVSRNLLRHEGFPYREDLYYLDTSKPLPPCVEGVEMVVGAVYLILDDRHSKWLFIVKDTTGRLLSALDGRGIALLDEVVGFKVLDAKWTNYGKMISPPPL